LSKNNDLEFYYTKNMTQVPSRTHKQSANKKKHSLSIHFGIPNIT